MQRFATGTIVCKMLENPMDSVLFGASEMRFRKAGVKGSNPFFGFDGEGPVTHAE
jgi:hypothetical protein